MAYIYHAAFLCDSCGEAESERLVSLGTSDDGDSDTFPQYFDEAHSETDCPSHCDSGGDCLESLGIYEHDKSPIPALIGEQLTDDGRAYVREAVSAAWSGRGGSSEVVGLWLEQWPECRPESEDEEE
jgi:hypothetical protein